MRHRVAKKGFRDERPFLVELSALDANKYDKILNWKQHADLSSTLDDNTVASRDSIVVSEFGDLKVTEIRQPQKYLTDEEVAQIIAEYQNDMTTYQLAEKYGCHRDTISKVLKKHSVNVSKSKAMDKLDPAKVIAMYESMRTTQQIADEFGVNPGVILKCLRANGVRIRTRWDY